MTLIEKLIKDGYNEQKAQALIMSGNVLVNEEVVIIKSKKIKESDNVRVKQRKIWVSRGAYKLLEALEKFDINVKNKICLDVGSSTGGFTHVLLEKGAKKIYALDSGTNQLDFSIRKNSRVVSLERTNLKSIKRNMFNEKIDFICCDVSFISVKSLFNVLAKENILSANNEIIILIKPQFEANSNLVKNGGFVDPKYHKEIIELIINFAQNLNFKFESITESPIKGNKSKNIEYLTFFRKV